MLLKPRSKVIYSIDWGKYLIFVAKIVGNYVHFIAFNVKLNFSNLMGRFCMLFDKNSIPFEEILLLLKYILKSTIV